MLNLALAVGDLLQDAGEDVVYTRVEDVYDSPTQKARMANEAGADWFISFHRNSSERPNQYEGVETLVFDNSGEKVELAEKINENLAALGFRNIGVKERPNLAVLRRTKMPAVLIEAGFINSERDNELFDDQFEEIAKGIANAVLDVAGNKNSDPNYHVQVGAYRNRQYAEELAQRLIQDGFSAQIIPANGYQKVVSGSFENLDNAVRLEQRLRRAGYQTYIIKNN